MSAVGLKPLGCVGDRQGMEGTGGVRTADVVGAAPVLNIVGGYSMAASVRARNGSVAGLVAMVIRCCGQVSTFRGWVLSGTEATTTHSEIEQAATRKMGEVASEFVDGKTVQLRNFRAYFHRNRWWE